MGGFGWDGDGLAEGLEVGDQGHDFRVGGDVRAGRDLYVSEGCYNCHSQMIRTLVPDVLRYGDYSRLGESIYDHPYQWGSKRTGPDLARVGGKYPNIWHLRHMEDPRAISAGLASRLLEISMEPIPPELRST